MTDPNEKKGFIDRIRSIPTNLSEMLYGRVQPQARDLEEAIIGAMLLEKEAVGFVVGILKPEAFYVEAHQLICKIIFDLFSKNQPIDILTVIEGLKKAGDIERIGGAFFVAELTNKIGSSANVEYHCYIVYQKYLQREYIRLCSVGIKESYEDTTDVYEMLDNAVKELYELTTGISNKKIKGSDRFDSTIKRITEAKCNPSHITGISTGSPDLDKHTGGWQKSDLIVLAGRPGMSKTSVALQWGSAAVNNNKKVLFFSLEMGEHQIAMKELSQYSHVNSWRMRNGFVNDEELKKVINASEILSSRKMFIDDTPAISLQQLRAKAYQLAHNIDGLDMIIIDYMQLMSSPDSKRGNREQELAAISGGLKKLAKELDIPVISLSQLSRKVEERGDKRPLLSDIRESGAIEQDADQVIFLYRDSYYNHSKEDTNGVSEMEFIFAKFRGGETGTIKQWWIPKFTKVVPINDYTVNGTLPKAEMDFGGAEPELPTGTGVDENLPF